MEENGDVSDGLFAALEPRIGSANRSAKLLDVGLLYVRVVRMKPCILRGIRCQTFYKLFSLCR